MIFPTSRFLIALTALLLIIRPTFAETQSGYQMGLPEEAPGAELIKANELTAGIEQALASRATQNEAFLQQLSLCVAYSQIAAFDLADQACNAAVQRANELQATPRSVKREMRALALNNRAVMQISSGNKVAALQDLLLAVRFDANDLTTSNLQRLKLSINGQVATQFVLLQSE